METAWSEPSRPVPRLDERGAREWGPSGELEPLRADAGGEGDGLGHGVVVFAGKADDETDAASDAMLSQKLCPPLRRRPGLRG